MGLLTATANLPRQRQILKQLLVIFVAGLASVSSAVFSAPVTSSGSTAPLTVFVAREIITMEAALPRATAVAVADGKIVSVGSLQSLQPWISGREVTIDTTFKDNVLMPGFIDPHLHPSLPAIVTQFPFIAPEDWELPTGQFPAAGSEKSYVSRLQSVVAAHQKNPQRDPAVPFITWGYHPLWHGDIYREKLDKLYPQTPVILWHRSFHELIANSAALTLLGVSEDEVKGRHGIDWKKGHFWEHGAQALVTRMGFLFAPKRYSRGLQNFIAMLHRGGVTSAMDMGTGIFGNAEAEMAMIQQAMDRKNVATRIILTPIVTDFISRGVEPEQALEEVKRWTAKGSEKVFFDNHFKLMLDGAIFSGLAQYQFPGYIDGHEGVWLAPLDKTFDYALAFWKQGYQIHAHTNGDKSAARLIEILSRLQIQHPRIDHRTSLEHFAYATEDQLRRLSDLGVVISANPYYQFILSDLYAEQWLGSDRARNMVPLGAAIRAGIPIALHSDSPMAPLSPLRLAWAAVNRVTINGNNNNASQKLTVHQALRAITIDAAWVMRRENQLGSIRAGKLADFVVLDKDPYRVNPDKLKDIEILATVFEGEKHPIQQISWKASNSPR
ncbi:MAG: amidohydrolase [Gammaproteobacteria bacterium]|nr:amidohydrolase [Gammaproteobacteria bacterium]